MKRHSLWFPTSSFGAMLGCAVAFTPLAAQTFRVETQINGVRQAPAATPEKLDEESEEKIGQIFEKLREHHDRVWKDRMSKEITEIGKATGLSEAQKKTLEEVSGKALEQSWADFQKKYNETLRAQLGTRPGTRLQTILRQVANVQIWESLASRFNTVRPNDTALWKDTIKQNLTAEQVVGLERLQAARAEELEKEYKDLLDMLEEPIRRDYERKIQIKAGSLKQMLGLTAERGTQLDELAQRAVDQSMKGWRKRAQAYINQASEEYLVNMKRSRSLYLGKDPNESPDQQAAWKDGLNTLLTAQEIKRYEDALLANKNRRLSVLSQVLVTRMDDAVAFTSEQREQLQELVERLIRQNPQMSGELTAEHGGSVLNSRNFDTAAAQARPEELAKILDPQQIKRWQKASGPNAMNAYQYPQEEEFDPGQPQLVKAQEVLDQQNLDQEVATFLYKKYHEERARVLERQLLMVEDLGRVLHLGPEIQKQLKLAAQGQTDEVMRIRNRGMEQRVRSQVAGVTTEKELRRKLQSMDRVSFGTRNAKEAVPEYIQKVVDGQLNGVMKSAWDKEVEMREAYRNRAIASVILLQLDRRFSLTSEQWNKFQVRLSGILEEYGPDINGMFAGSSPNSWYMETYSMYIPMGGIPPEEIAGILGAEKADQWAKSGEGSSSRHYWENINRRRDLRLKK